MSNQSVSQRLHDRLGRLIAATEPGNRLPSEPDLAQQFGVSRATLREAMRTFETQGRIRRKQGSGTFVTYPGHVIESGLEVLESINILAERSGMPVTMGALSVEQRKPNEDECEALDITSESMVISVSRVIMAENRPVAYLIDTLPHGILAPEELETNFTGSILDLLQQRGTPPLLTSRTEINAVTATTKVARALETQSGAVLLRFIAKLYTTSGQVVDYSFSYFLPGYFRFHVVRKVG